MKYDYTIIKLALEGKRLIGFQNLSFGEYSGSADNGILLLLGKMPNPDYVVLESENQDYSMFDKWVIRTSSPTFVLDDRYKSIGEVIDEVEIKEISYDNWHDGTNQFQLIIKTKTKNIRLGHRWNDCHYPNSIWDVI